MGYKNDDRCLAKVDDDEPIFVLRAQDKTAPVVVQTWLDYNADTLTKEHYGEAVRLVALMQAWQIEHPDRVKFPD